MTDQFTATLNRFCAGLSEKIAVLVAEDPADPAIQILADGLLNAVRETIANLLLIELECEQLLRRG